MQSHRLFTVVCFIVSSVVSGVVCGVAVAGDVAEDVASERVTFTTSDSESVQIVGDFYMADDRGRKPAVVILLHMYKTDRSTYAPLIAALNKRGIAALAIDLRGHGESIEPTSAQLAERVDQRERKVFQDMKYDVQGAYTWLAEKDEVDLSRVGLVGASVGCTVAFRYAIDDKSVDVIVALSPGRRYMKIRSEPDLKKIEGRSILFVSPESEIDNANALKKAYEEAEIKMVSGQTADGGNIHGTRMFGAVDGIEAYIAGYLAGRLGDPSTEIVVSKFKGPFYMPVDHKRASRLTPDKRRIYSDAEEAESRGLRLVGTSKGASSMGAVEL